MKKSQIDQSLETAALIKAAIKNSGMKKAHIAEMLGVTAQAVQGWENTGRIQLTTLRQLGKLLGKNLIGDEDSITDLPEITQQIIELMKKTDVRGRQKILNAALDAFELHDAHLKKVAGKKPSP